MSIRRHLAISLAAVTMSNLVAHAQAPPSAQWSDHRILGGGSTASEGIHGDTDTDSTGNPQFRVVVIGYFEGACIAGEPAIRYERTDLLTHTTETYLVCPGMPGPAASPAVAPAAAPPSPSEVWGQIDIPLPHTRISPPTRGLVGFETWLWYDQATTLHTTIALPPAWTLTIDAHATHWHWDLGDTTTADSHVPGRDGWPAATVAYQYPCTCHVSATVTWTGTYTVTLPDGTTTTIDLGNRDFTGPAHPYPVEERQAVITSNH